jgi:hypothetical protein
MKRPAGRGWRSHLKRPTSATGRPTVAEASKGLDVFFRVLTEEHLAATGLPAESTEALHLWHATLSVDEKQRIVERMFEELRRAKANES